MRDIEKKPYSYDEARVAEWFVDRCGIGGGDDPIGSMLASYDYVVHQRNTIQQAAKDLLDALKEVITISDRKHNAWDKAKAAMRALEETLYDGF